MPRKPIVGGNWKCNPKTLEEALKLIGDWKNQVPFDKRKIDVFACPMMPHLLKVKLPMEKLGISACAQNCSKTGEGAFTGEVSAAQLKDARVQWTLLGHSERRSKYGETDEDVAEKVSLALAAGLKVVLAIGELLEEREAGKTNEVNERMLDPVIKKLKPEAEPEKPSAIRPLHDEVASRYKELVRREQALAAREKLAAEVCQAQEEREQDLEDFALRLQQQEEALKKQEQQIAKEKQEAARDSLAKTACSEARQHDEAAGLRLSERAGRLASREKRVAEDEAELLRREKRMSEKKARMNGRERDLMEAESRNMRELAARRRQAELRELRVADLESRLAEAWRYRSMDRCSQGPTTNLPELPPAGADADVSCASGASRASIGRASIGRASVGRPSIGRSSIGRMSIEPSVSCVSALSVEDSGASHRMSTRSTVSAAPEAPAHLVAPPSGAKQEVPEITGTHLGQAEAVEFQDASGDIVSFKLNGNGGVDFFLNGHKEVSDVDCFARGRTLHLAGSCDKWSAARQTTVPEGQEAVLQRVLALFHPAAPCPEETPALPETNTRLRTPAEMETSMNSTSGMVGPGEELTQTIKISAIQEEGCRSSSKVVRFVESRGSTPLAPPASWERLPLEEAQKEGLPQQEPHDAEASRPRLTARKRVQVKEAQDAPSDEKWYSSALRRLTRCGGT